MTGLQSLIERMMVWVMMCSFLCSGWMKAADYNAVFVLRQHGKAMRVGIAVFRRR